MDSIKVTLHPGEYVVTAADAKRAVAAVGDQLAAIVGWPQLGEDAVTVLEPHGYYSAGYVGPPKGALAVVSYREES